MLVRGGVLSYHTGVTSCHTGATSCVVLSHRSYIVCDSCHTRLYRVLSYHTGVISCVILSHGCYIVCCLFTRVLYRVLSYHACDTVFYPITCVTSWVMVSHGYYLVCYLITPVSYRLLFFHTGVISCVILSHIFTPCAIFSHVLYRVLSHNTCYIAPRTLYSHGNIVWARRLTAARAQGGLRTATVGDMAALRSLAGAEYYPSWTARLDQ